MGLISRPLRRDVMGLKFKITVSNSKMRISAGSLLFACLLVTGCASRSVVPAEPALQRATAYLHSVRTTQGTAELQVAVRRFTSPSYPGQTVWLVGASHLGDFKYYTGLQKLLNAQDVVLFEGVRASEHAATEEEHEPHAIDRQALDDSLQGSMARALGLVFQLTAVDYSLKHFRNSDLSLPDIERLVSSNLSAVKGEEGQAEASAEFALLTQALSGDSWLNVVANVMLSFVHASPKLQGLARLMLIEVTGSVAADMESLAAMSPGMKGLITVLVEARNKKVMGDLQSLLKKDAHSKSIAIFYGAAHMKDFEARLANELSYLPREERWLTAFDVDLKSSGIGEGEEKILRSLLDWQLEALGQRGKAAP